MAFAIADFVSRWKASPFGQAPSTPWDVTGDAERLVEAALGTLGRDFEVHDGVAIHNSATVEAGAVIKAPAIISANCLIAAGAYLRGGVFLDNDCIVGPNSELRSSFLMADSKLAHLNFVGDSILGAGVDVEAGAILANYRNEHADPAIRIAFEGETIETGVTKFGALIGDRTKIGANAVIAPGAILRPGTIVGRLKLVDQFPAG